MWPFSRVKDQSARAVDSGGQTPEQKAYPVEAVAANARDLVSLFDGQWAHTTFRRSLEEALTAEEQKITELKSFYRPNMSGVRCLTYEYMRSHDCFLRYQDIDPSFFSLGAEDYFFVSHRWESPANPDPDGRQFQIVRKRFEERVPEEERASVGIWFDFSCMSQRDSEGKRSQVDQEEFNKTLRVIHLLPLLARNTIIPALPDLSEQNMVLLGVDAIDKDLTLCARSSRRNAFRQCHEVSTSCANGAFS